MKLQVSKRKKVIKIKVETKIIETRKTIDNIGVTKSRFFEKITKVDKPLTRLMRGKKKKKKRRDSKNDPSEMREVLSLQIIQITKG